MKISNIDKTGSGTASISKYTHPHFGIIIFLIGLGVQFNSGVHSGADHKRATLSGKR